MAEWLTHITPDTSYQEMLERPSAFNPEPGLVNSNLEISRIGALTERDNMQHILRYGNGVMYEVEWPMQQPVEEDSVTTRPISEVSELPDAWRRMTTDSFEHFESFWEVQATALSHNRLLDDGKEKFDKAFSYAANRGVFAEPRGFIQYASRVFEFSLNNDMPATAYAVAKAAFSGVMTVQGKTLHCHRLRHWLDENVTHVLEPGLSQAVRDIYDEPTDSTRSDIFRLDRMRRDIAMYAIELAQQNLVMRSLKRADEHYANKNPALTEKIVWHQIATGKESILAAQRLTKSIKEVPESVRGTTSLKAEQQTPQQIGAYVLNILN